MNKLEKIENENLRNDIPEFAIGDTVRADLKVVEGGKERIQSFTGMVIARNGRGINDAMTLRRIAFGQGIERVIPLHSPKLAKLDVVRRARTRRSKLYYIRSKRGRAARLKERV